MHETEASKYLQEAVSVTREDISRGKDYLLKTASGAINEIADQWLREQNLSIPQAIDGDASNVKDVLDSFARAINVKLALFQAAWELIASGELICTGAATGWKPSANYKSLGYLGGVRLQAGYTHPSHVERLPLVNDRAIDTDIFLQEVDCKTLHPGIVHAVTQSLGCFRRGLYMPAIAMLAAAGEATWTECGIAVAKKLSNTRLDRLVNDPLASIGKKVTEIRAALEQVDGKALLKAANQHIAKVTDAEVWTTTLRDRRNALHWSKARSFIADHSETGILLMAAPIHIGTLEAIRAAC
jgi:hypothetical protein